MSNLNIGQELSLIEILQLHCFSILKSIARFTIKRIERTHVKVSEEYNDGHWKRILDEKKWLEFQTLDSYLFSFQSKSIKCIFNSKYIQIDSIKYYRSRTLELNRILKQNFGNLDEIVELGSGTGFNIFSLAAELPESKLVGLDISPNGIQASREIAEHFNLSDRVKFEVLDLTDAKHVSFKYLRGKNCFSFFCLEQIPYSIEKVIENILASNPRKVLHIEPSIELLTWKRAADWSNFFYVKSVDYQTQLFTVLKKLNSQHVVNLLTTGEFKYSPTIHNRGFLAVWEPGSKPL